MTSETHPTAVQTALLTEDGLAIYALNERGYNRWIALFQGDEAEEAASAVYEAVNGYAQAIRERDEAIALLREAELFVKFERSGGLADRISAFLSNFSEEDAENKERE